uniref:Uncharacterized protein n=1 Tax=Romanomermis culicivorax TaxID=13658 RepID=A0A915KVR0_ROMCU
LRHRIFNASNFTHQQLLVTIPSNKPGSKEASSPDNPMDFFDSAPSHPRMTDHHGHAAQPSPPTTARTRKDHSKEEEGLP